MEHVILVDARDNQVGTKEKLAAHEEGLLHRAFSVLILDSRGRLLLQQRAPGKYHCGGLWTNTCCSHPRPGESLPDAAHRRLREEIGMSASLEWRFSFIYKAACSELTEHELDHIFVGYSDETPDPAAEEVADYAWCDPEQIKKDIAARPGLYTPWFVRIMQQISL